MEEEIREEIVSEEKSEANRFEEDSNSELNRKLRQYFDGKIVRKDLTKHIKEPIFYSTPEEAVFRALGVE